MAVEGEDREVAPEILERYVVEHLETHIIERSRLVRLRHFRVPVRRFDLTVV